jgi:hypothetical protein
MGSRRFVCHRSVEHLERVAVRKGSRTDQAREVVEEYANGLRETIKKLRKKTLH